MSTQTTSEALSGPSLEASPNRAADDKLVLPEPGVAWVPRTTPDSLAADLSIGLMPRPGSAFHYKDRYLYYATELRTVVEIDAFSYWMLRATLLGGTMHQTLDLLVRNGHAATPGEIIERLTQYRDLGLFRAPPAHVAGADIERTISGLLAHQPMKMMLFMAQSCNLRCTYCYGIEGNYQDLGQKMSRETAQAAVDYLVDGSPSRSHYYVYFFGGEPLLNLPVMKETVKYARAKVEPLGKTIEFGVTTNGTLLTDDAVSFLIGEDFQICVSLDGTQKGHDINRPTKGGSGSHAFVLRGYEKLKQLSRRAGQVKIRATMSHQNHDPLEISEYFESIGITNYGIGTTFERAGNPQSTDVTEDDLKEMDASFEKALDTVVDRLAKKQRLPRYNPFFKTVGGLTLGQSRAFIGCGVCRNDQGIGTDGNIYPCHRYVGLKNYVIGDVRNGLDREKTRAVYRQYFDMWNRHCQNCWARYVCSGACAWQHSHDDGDLRNPNPQQCESIRRSIHRSVWLSVHLGRNHPEVLEALAKSNTTSGACCNPQ
jgi:uncharacterized protein